MLFLPLSLTRLLIDAASNAVAQEMKAGVWYGSWEWKQQQIGRRDIICTERSGVVQRNKEGQTSFYVRRLTSKGGQQYMASQQSKAAIKWNCKRTSIL